MPIEQEFYEGRKGQKRLRAIEKQIRRVDEEFEHNYEDTPEMVFFKEEVRWEGIARLIFAMACRNVQFKWNGTRDYGFIRLCRAWADENHMNIITADIMSAMLRDILPEAMCAELEEELAALEIF